MGSDVGSDDPGDGVVLSGADHVDGVVLGRAGRNDKAVLGGDVREVDNRVVLSGDGVGSVPARALVSGDADCGESLSFCRKFSFSFVSSSEPISITSPLDGALPEPVGAPSDTVTNSPFFQ